MSDEQTPPMARPRVAAGALIRNEAGEVLLVKPTYKEGWEIPGGYVEPGESPKAACEREVREELGIDISVGRLLVVDWAPAPNEGDKILFVFDAGTHPSATVFWLPADEIGAANFVREDQLASLLPPRLSKRVAVALDALNHTAPSYIEHGTIPR